jgi:hypothetical protein
MDAAQIALKFQHHGTLLPEIAFSDFGRRKIEPVIPGLVQLFNFTTLRMRDFEGLL